mmetsp:Transcript_22322/g.32954  ORF Transcript_22322/g.32954 Transcript_22322/m.32954 type:complete len:153 (+) Transcript_22322:83-541(+)|eukprot:CAMPEP_0194207598 /NCGR_PEP_ID=MMETSP0156-20130528/6291_1 /TAXON_ID=33649 /ORGANISM="Thalassionema nitzschioides, Strain L26-B" /LENGTH=152 /DNA_ID=CAMNT_0038934395 /DNA_START=46 /DNA_END=504 /DNA_ORIENTATION=-
MGSDNQSSNSAKEAIDNVKETFNKALKSQQNDAQGFKKTLTSAMKSAVDSTNKTLASIEESTEAIRKPLAETTETISREGKKLAYQASNFYAVRQQYGLENIAGATLLGGLVGLRRGRIPAATIGSLSGFLAYIFVYEVDARQLPSKLFGRD